VATRRATVVARVAMVPAPTGVAVDHHAQPVMVGIPPALAVRAATAPLVEAAVEAVEVSTSLVLRGVVEGLVVTAAVLAARVR